MQTSPRLILLWRVLVFFAALSPLGYWSAQVALGHAGPEPGQYLLLKFGLCALVLLLLTLALTPLTRLTGWRGFTAIRRQLGLWCFAYALLHLTSYVLFILGLDVSLLWDDIQRRPYIIVGALALLGLLVMAVTSNRVSMRRLGKRWKRVHSLVYGVLLLVLLHFFWVVRADMAEWAGYALAGAALLLLRLDALSRRLPALGRRLRLR
ncbi:protein-methionine-sulfoxide reductase heme-binding subunit MsrQ [Larsenimonas suaedae]|uniref:Protein-methionine-sulfoxide reductase heme-binding subunit MsrQ n=1 Tax=Larsenimonas suaedae TaxID=1851019 RepID=A0ABU1GTY2_9GAMM|nr:protein-methionine-sulfoxide reductase heme-binding subunit MsrQ [Larsenimonas suaedae]MCM2972247.1 protein-methionine-sulfoxide reductase heme-binding subunit MsrQ [Larsenimonas suaedae]MDR5894957.1 protein-methionine-sulfoxide reductase heme-binding subunit MsrQ [Larsenimonas suaedae]